MAVGWICDGLEFFVFVLEKRDTCTKRERKKEKGIDEIENNK